MLKIENFTPSKALAILPGPRTSFLDHLIPLCAFWDIPLLCTDAWVHTCAQAFYPKQHILYAQQEDLQQIVENYQTFVTVEPCRLHSHTLQFGDLLIRTAGRTVAGFHGNPMKYRTEYWIERYAHEDYVLIYGQFLIDYLKEKGVWDRIKTKIYLGNIRKTYYHRNRSFFDRCVDPLLPFTSKYKTLFYAPTWSYPQWNEAAYDFIKTLPNEYRICLKLHPYMYRLFPEKIDSLKGRFLHNDRVIFIDENPLVYPFLDRADVFLGDSSSIVYDFLSFDRPIFFLGERDIPWGTCITDLSCIYSLIEKEDGLSEQRQKAYHYAFGG
jgi:hypothetical protein